MTSIKGHYDGTAVILDEPAALTPRQAVRVIIEPSSARTRFSERRLLPDFVALPSLAGDNTLQISANRDASGR